MNAGAIEENTTCEKRKNTRDIIKSTRSKILKENGIVGKWLHSVLSNG